MIGYNYKEKNSAIRFKLLDMIRAGKLPGIRKDNKLPSENELARILDASLLTVREALKILEYEGYISKKHGAGNFYHQSALDVKMRFDVIADFSALIEDGGYKVRTSQTNHVIRKPTKKEQEIFGLDSNEVLVSFDRTYYADGRVAIMMKLFTPCSLLTVDFDNIQDVTTMEELLWNHAREKIVNSIETWVPRHTTKEEAEAFGLPKNTPVICNNEAFYSIKDKKIGYASTAFNPELLEMNMIRKWY